MALRIAEQDKALIEKLKKKGSYIPPVPPFKKDKVLAYTGDEITEILAASDTPIDPEYNVPGTRSLGQVIWYRRQQIMRLTVRGVPYARIAEHLAIPIETVRDDVRFNNETMRVELQQFDYPAFIGNSMAFYREARNMALHLAQSATDAKSRISAIKTAVGAEDSLHAFMAQVGLFKTVPATDPFNEIRTGRHGNYSDENDMGSFVQLVAQTVEGESTRVEEAP